MAEGGKPEKEEYDKKKKEEKENGKALGAT